MSESIAERQVPDAVTAAPAGGAASRSATGVGVFGALRRLLGSSDLRRVLPGLMVSGLLSNMLALALPLAILQILDRVVKNQAMATLTFLAIGVVAALILEELLRALNGVVTSWLGARFEHRATLEAMERLLKVPMRRYAREEPGAYAEKLHAAAKVAEFYSGQALLVLFDLPFAALFLLLIYLIAGQLVWVPAILLLVFALFTVRYGRWMRDQVQARHLSDDRRFSFLTEVLSGIHSVKTMMMEDSMLRRYERLQEANAEQGEKLTHGSTLATGLGTLFSQVMIAGVIFSGAWVVIDGEMTPGSLAACMMLSVRSLAPLRRGLAVWLRYQGFVAADRRLSELMELPVVEEADKPPLPRIGEGLELRQVEVCFDAERPLFSGLDLTIPAGGCIAIRGESGSGKSTLMALLAGMERPDRGEMLVDGQPLAGFSADSFHRRIALLPQSGTVVAGTILDNLTMYEDRLKPRALEVARELGLDTIVSGMRLGYETRLGEDAGETLPMGVRQLITIIRALTRDPEVILFDEANIALDIDGDRVVRQYLEREKGRRTLVLVTHRPSLLRLADRVYTLADGRLREGEPSRAGDAGESEEPIPRPAGERPEAQLVAERFRRATDLSNCLLPLLHRLGWDGRERELAEALPHMDEQLDLSGFFAVLANLDYPPRHAGHLSDHPDPRLLPCLYLPKGSGAQLVLECSDDGRLRLFDGVSAEERWVDRLPGGGDFYVFKKRERPNTRAAAVKSSWLGGLIWRFRRHLGMALAVTVLSTVLALATPLFVMSMYDRVLPAGDIRMAAYLLVGVGIATALNWMLTVFKSRLLAYVGGRSEYILGVSVFARIIGLPASSIEGLSVSRQVGRIRNLERLREFFLGPLALLAFDLPATLVMLTALIIINPWILAVLAVSACAFGLLGLAVRQTSGRAVETSSRGSALRWEFINETLSAMRVIRATGAGPTWMARLREMSGHAVMNAFREHQAHQRVGAIAQTIGTGTGVMALIVSAILATHGQITSGAMIATMILTWRLTGPMQNVFLAATSIVRVTTNIRQVENLMRLPGERDSGVKQTIRPETRGGLALSRVSFRYANDADPALLGVTFVARPKQMVAITGPDGAGKSTLFKQILRVYVPQAGTLRLDNVDIRQLTTTDLRSQISYMPQNCELFYGTVTQNLRLVHPAATDEEVRWAAEMAGLREDVEALPYGFDTRISNSRSDQLPHGFRQRLSLARTVLKPASVVLMDEPGTGMDRAGEAALTRCIRWLRGRATLLIVTHRPGHMRMSDLVVYLEKGSVTAMGPFDKIQEKVMAGLR
ncbi:peptidase domain-containing ABC transporter [Endothiovibrio diazotrophicus]